MLISLVSSWCHQQMLDQTKKYLPGTNTLAYLASLSATKKKSFITLTPDGLLARLSHLEEVRISGNSTGHTGRQMAQDLTGAPGRHIFHFFFFLRRASALKKISAENCSRRNSYFNTNSLNFRLYRGILKRDVSMYH